jgi:Right handed beta helix region
MSNRLCVAAFAAAIACACGIGSAHAQTRTFVSGSGSDSNPCSVTAPCRSFQAAYNAVAAGGEIDVLTPAGYGALTISKAVSIQGHGFAGITAPSGSSAITINGAATTDQINLRGLLIDGAGAGGYGVWVLNSVGTVNIQDCVIRDLQYYGILFQPQSAAQLFVSDTIVSDTFSGQGAGIYVSQNGSNAVSAVLSNVEVDNNYYGVWVIGPNVVISGSAISGNSKVGVEVDGTGTAVLSNSMLTGNVTGWGITVDGSVQSSGDNLIDDNPNGNTAPPPVVYE